MTEFEGTIRMPGDPIELAAVLQIADGRLKMSANEHDLGDWPLADIVARVAPDGCHVVVEGETLIVNVPHPARFTKAISGPPVLDPVPDAPEDPPVDEVAADSPSDENDPARGIMARMPARWKLVGGAALFVAILWIFAPVVLVGLLLTVALALLVAGAVAGLDPFTAVRLPNPISAPRLLAAGSVVVAVSLFLANTIT